MEETKLCGKCKKPKGQTEESCNCGRPTLYSQELADEICHELALGKSMRAVCREESMPDLSTVFRWLRTNQEFCSQYASATEERTEAQNEDLLELGDEAINLAQIVDPKASGAVVQGVKLKADNLKWVMSKMKPKKYGDKIDMTTNGKDLPTPLLNALYNNHSNQEDSQSKEKD